MKQSLIFLLFSIFLLSGCGDATAPATNPSPAGNSDYSLDSTGKIATVSTSKGLKDMLAKGSVETIKLNSGNYDEEYEVNDVKTIEGSSTTTINKISVNETGAKISSPKIKTFHAGKCIGDGELTLDNVTIDGDAVFQGGGEHSIKVTGTSIFNGAVTLDKEGLSLKMGALTEITKSLVVLQPANLMPIDETADLPTIKGSVVINYTEASDGVTKINIKATNLVIGETVTNVTIEGGAEIATLFTKVAGINITNNGIIQSANDVSVIKVNTQGIKPIDLTENYELQEIIVLSKFNDLLPSGLDINAIKTHFLLPAKISITTDFSLPLTWTSSNTEVISISSGMATVNRPEVATQVVLTATVTINGKVITKEFTVTVSAKETVEVKLSELPPAADGTWVMPVPFPPITVSGGKMTFLYVQYVVKYDTATGAVYGNTTLIPKLIWRDTYFEYNGNKINKELSSSTDPVNLALNKTAYSSTDESSTYSVDQAVDGNSTTTRWASGSNFTTGQWIYIDLGKATDFNTVTLKFEAGSNNYNIEYSNDATSWDIIQSALNTGNGANNTITASSLLNARYIRMIAYNRIGTYGVSLYEFEVYNK